jgi:heme oxygenase
VFVHLQLFYIIQLTKRETRRWLTDSAPDCCRGRHWEKFAEHLHTQKISAETVNLNSTIDAIGR